MPKPPRIVQAEAEYELAIAPAKRLMEQAHNLRDNARNLDNQAMEIKQAAHHLITTAVKETFTPGLLVTSRGQHYGTFRVNRVEGSYVWLTDPDNIRRRVKASYFSLTIKEPSDAEL